MGAAGAHPLEDVDAADDAALREVALDENVAYGVKPGEGPIGVEGDVVLKEPEAHLGRTVVGEAVEAKVDDQLAADVVCRGEGVGNIIFIWRWIATLPAPSIQV